MAHQEQILSSEVPLTQRVEQLSDHRTAKTSHWGRLCRTGAPRAVRQRAALVSASTTHCSAAQSMASAGYKATPQSSNEDEPADKTRKQKNANEFKKNLDDLSRLSGYLGAKQQRTIKTTNRNKQKNSNKGKKYTNSQFTDAKVYSYSHA
jgi:hypothetical protein